MFEILDLIAAVYGRSQGPLFKFSVRKGSVWEDGRYIAAFAAGDGLGRSKHCLVCSGHICPRLSSFADKGL